jgi:hypothetical protein
MWPRDEDLRIESAASAERFIEDVGQVALTHPSPNGEESLTALGTGKPP